ncbi:MAG: lysophospholipid acyltransferase family protein [Oscillospiraceae bacterium]
MRFFYTLFYILAYPFMRVVFPCHIRGRENIPEGAVVACANHSSLLDAVLMAIAFGIRRQLFFMTKADLFEIPVLGSILRAAQAFPVERGETDITAIRTAIKHLKNGERIMIFPEGTRVTESESADAKSGAVRIASKLKAPIVPVYISTGKRAFHFSRLEIGEAYMAETPKDRDFLPLADDLMKRIYAMENKN